MNMSQYIPNFSSNQINGYDLVYLTREDMKSLGLSNIHDINIILSSIKDLILKQLKLNINFEGKNATIQLDCDRNFTVEKFINTLTDIFKPTSKIFLLINSNDILMPNLKIVDLILHNPNIYKNFKIIPSERLPTFSYSPKIGEFTSTTTYTNNYSSTMRNNNYFKENNENNGNKQKTENIINANSYLRQSNSSKNLTNLGNYDNYRKTYLDIQESKINDNTNTLNVTKDPLFNRYRNLGEYNSNLSKTNVNINNYLPEDNNQSKGKNNFYTSRNNNLSTTQQVNQRVPSLDLKTNLYNNNTNSYINSTLNNTPQPLNRQNTIPNYRRNYGLQNGELSIGDNNDEVKNNNMKKIDYSQTVYGNMKQEVQKEDDSQRYSSEKREFRGIESGNNFYTSNLNNNNNYNSYKYLNGDWKNNSNIFNMKTNNSSNYMAFPSATPKITERRQYDTSLKIETKGYLTGYGEK